MSKIDTLLQANIKGESIIDSLNVGEKVSNLIKYITDKNISATDVIKISDFLCNKIHDYFFLSAERKEIIIQKLRKCIYDSIDLPDPLRLSFLKFKNTSVSYSTCCNLYYDGIRERLEIMSYFQLLNYVLGSEYTDSEVREKILDEFERIFENDETNEFVKMQIADIFILNKRAERGHIMLDIIRGIRIVDEQGNAIFKKKTTIYDDSQNVHDKTVNNSVLKAAIYLIDTNSTVKSFNSASIIAELCELSPNDGDAISTVINRVEIDTSRFRLDDNSFSLYDVFSSLWIYINKSKHKDTLKTRLIEEIVSMYRYCSTGHLSRFMNVIQGYTEDDSLQIRISDFDQIKSVVYHFLNTSLKSASEDVMDSMIGDDKQVFYKFVLENINTKIPELVKEYGDVLDSVLQSVIKYTNYTEWSASYGLIAMCARPDGSDEPDEP